jgi:hypothetical protein
MTAIKDALQKAGLDVAAAELHTFAVQAIRGHAGSAADAAGKFEILLRKRPDLFNALVRGYLLQVAGDMKVAGELITPLPAPRDVKVSKMTIPEHGRRAHQRSRRRTAGEKAAAMRVAGQMNEALRSVFDRRVIDGRAIGDLAWGELGTLVDANANNAASYLRLGTEATENAIILDKVHAHANVQDHRTKVRDVLTEAQLMQFIEDARAEAPLVVQMGMHHYRETIRTFRTTLEMTKQ